MIDRPRYRLLALAVLFCALFGLLVLSGTMTPDPERNHYPDRYDLGADYDAHLDEHVEVSGTVIATDPVTLEIRYDTDRTLVFTVTGVEESLEDGQELRVFGTAGPDRTIEAHRTVVVSPWETYYAWLVSFVAGVWVLGRFVHGWRFDRSTLAFEPREGSDA